MWGFLFLSLWCYAAWSSLPHATLPDLFRSFFLNKPNHVFQLDLFFMMLRCLMLYISCYAASTSLTHVKLLHALNMRSRYLNLILSLWCYAAWSSLPHATLLNLPLLVCNAAWCPLYQIMLFHLVFMMLGCLIFSVSCCAAWPSLPHAKVLDDP